MNHAPVHLGSSMGFMVDNLMEGPALIVTKSHVGGSAVNIIINDGTNNRKVITVALRQLVNALQMVVSDARDNGIIIITPEVAS